MSFTCPRRGCAGFWAADAAAMADHRSGHGPEDHTAALTRGVRWVVWAVLVTVVPMVALVGGVVSYIVVTGASID